MSDHQPESGDARVGLEDRFRVERLTPSSRGIDHTDCRYFVLDPLHDPIARFALAEYASRARAEGRDALADDLHAWLSDLAVTDLRERLTPARADVECGSCGEGTPTGECPKSERSCGHHCNHVWIHDACDWCGIEFLGDGEVRTPSGSEAPDA